eukprot:jgi/Bigna1/65075/fgenesh1_kg.96_\
MCGMYLRPENPHHNLVTNANKMNVCIFTVLVDLRDATLKMDDLVRNFFLISKLDRVCHVLFNLREKRLVMCERRKDLDHLFWNLEVLLHKQGCISHRLFPPPQLWKAFRQLDRNWVTN